MTRLQRRNWAIVATCIVLSIAVLYCGVWMWLVQRATTTLQQDQQVALASDRYQQALRWAPPGAAIIPGLRGPLREILLKQAQILFITQKSDEALRFFQSLPSRYAFVANDPEYHLWYGNTLFQRGIFQE